MPRRWAAAPWQAAAPSPTCDRGTALRSASFRNRRAAPGTRCRRKQSAMPARVQTACHSLAARVGRPAPPGLQVRPAALAVHAPPPAAAPCSALLLARLNLRTPTTTEHASPRGAGLASACWSLAQRLAVVQQRRLNRSAGAERSTAAAPKARCQG